MRQSRVHYISLASVISAFAVIMLHTNGCFWVFSSDRYWFTANIIESVMYFAVPVFFMISGATLIDYRERYETKEYLKKRILKTVIPFVVWSLIGVLYRIIKGYTTFSSGLAGIKEVVRDIMNVQVVSVYWFFIPLFGIYLCIPLLSAVKNELKDNLFLFFVVVAFVFNSLIPFVCNIFEIDYTQRITVNVASGYMIWVLLGYLISKKDIPRNWRILSYVLSVVGLILHIAGTYIASINAGQIISTYKGYNNVPCILYSVGVFIFIKEVGQKIKSERFIKVLNFFNGYTFAIYLMHWFVMDMFVDMFSINTYSIIYRVGAPILIGLICVGIAWLIRKIPMLRKFVP